MLKAEFLTVAVRAARRRRILPGSQPDGKRRSTRPPLPPVTPRVVFRSLQVFSWFAAYLVVFVVVLGPFLWLAIALRDWDRRLPRRIVRALYRHGMRGFCGSNMQIQAFDWDHIKGPCILVANHQSAIDILLLLQLPPDARCWAKKWPFKMPFLGALMKLCGHLRVDHENVLEQAMESMRRGVSLYVFPEGTRSRNGRLGRFHDGAFLLAVRMNCPVVPVAIHGSGRCMIPDHIRIHDVPLRVEPLGILHPDPTAEKPHLRLKHEAFGMISRALRSERGMNPLAKDPAAESL